MQDKQYTLFLLLYKKKLKVGYLTVNSIMLSLNINFYQFEQFSDRKISVQYNLKKFQWWDIFFLSNYQTFFMTTLNYLITKAKTTN